jgi:hypothetical protein
VTLSIARDGTAGGAACRPASARVLTVPLLLFVFLGGPSSAAWATAKKPPAAGRQTNARTGRIATPFGDLVRAARKNDRGALERLASRMSPAQLEEALSNPNEAVVQAALAAIPFARGRVLLTASVTDRLGAPRASLVTAAARTLGELLDGASPYELEEWEVPPDTVAYACGGLRTVAARVEAPIPARLAALDSLALAHTTCTATAELTPLLRDPVPAVRRAAALVLRPAERQVASALRDVIRDPTPSVASAAVAAVCRSGGSNGTGLRKRDSLVDQSITAARGMSVLPTTPPEDAIEMLACVAAAGTSSDRALLERLRRGPASPLRDRAAELAEAGNRVKPE